LAAGGSDALLSVATGSGSALSPAGAAGQPLLAAVMAEDARALAAERHRDPYDEHASVVVLPARSGSTPSTRPSTRSARASSRVTARMNDRRERNTTSRPPRFGAQGQRLIFLAAIASAIGLLVGGDYRHMQDASATVTSVPPSAAAKLSAPATETTHSAASETALAEELPSRTLPQPSDPPAMIEPAPDEPAVAESGVVQVQIRTQPSGASVRAVGTDAHCSAAPCAIEVPRGKPITLRAETGNRSVERTLTFDDKTEVELRVSSLARAKPSARPAANSGKLPSDLKVPAIFREP
jgi:hypothetical protein